MKGGGGVVGPPPKKKIDEETPTCTSKKKSPSIPSSECNSLCLSICKACRKGIACLTDVRYRLPTLGKVGVRSFNDIRESGYDAIRFPAITKKSSSLTTTRQRICIKPNRLPVMYVTQVDSALCSFSSFTKDELNGKKNQGTRNIQGAHHQSGNRHSPKGVVVEGTSRWENDNKDIFRKTWRLWQKCICNGLGVNIIWVGCDIDIIWI